MQKPNGTPGSKRYYADCGAGAERLTTEQTQFFRAPHARTRTRTRTSPSTQDIIFESPFRRERNFRVSPAFRVPSTGRS